MTLFIALTIGLFAGILSGFFGIGGGIVMVPMMVILLGFTQQEAGAASLAASLLPVGLLGVTAYWRAGYLPNDHVKLALLLALGVFIGCYFGARWAPLVPQDMLRKAFAVLLVITAIKIGTAK